MFGRAGPTIFTCSVCGCSWMIRHCGAVLRGAVHPLTLRRGDFLISAVEAPSLCCQLKPYAACYVCVCVCGTGRHVRTRLSEFSADMKQYARKPVLKQGLGNGWTSYIGVSQNRGPKNWLVYFC